MDFNTGIIYLLIFFVLGFVATIILLCLILKRYKRAKKRAEQLYVAEDRLHEYGTKTLYNSMFDNFAMRQSELDKEYNDVERVLGGTGVLVCFVGTMMLILLGLIVMCLKLLV